jgi:hypothetical protein
VDDSRVGVRPLRDKWQMLTRGRSDDGSLLLAGLFAVIMMGLLLAIAATIISGHHKTQQAHDYTLTQQALDAAVNDALVYANMDPVRIENGAYPSCGAAVATHPTGKVDSVTWRWCLSNVSGKPRWKIIEVTAETAQAPGSAEKKMTRRFNVELKPTFKRYKGYSVRQYKEL